MVRALARAEIMPLKERRPLPSVTSCPMHVLSQRRRSPKIRRSLIGSNSQAVRSSPIPVTEPGILFDPQFRLCKPFSVAVSMSASASIKTGLASKGECMMMMTLACMASRITIISVGMRSSGRCGATHRR